MENIKQIARRIYNLLKAGLGSQAGEVPAGRFCLPNAQPARRQEIKNKNGGIRMTTKRYFLEHYQNSIWARYLEVKEKDIEKVVGLAGTAYVPKEDIENIELYRIENEFSNEIMDAKDAENYVFLDIDELTHDERLYLFEGEFTHLIDLEAVEDVDLDRLTDEQYTDLAIEVFTELEKDIVKKMKEDGIDGKDMEWYEIYRWWDGSHWRTELLSHYYADTLKEVTEELEGMEEIDREQYNTGHDTLYKTKDGSKVLVYTSYWQGQGKSIAFLPDDIETVGDAREYVFLQEQKFFGSM